MANGRAITGFSSPRVALYSASGTTVTYSGGIPLARGVNVKASINSSDVKFFADNSLAEGSVGMFVDGTLTITADQPLDDAMKMITGQTATAEYGSGNDAQTFDAYTASTVAPYVGVGFVVRYQSGGVTGYSAVIFPKVQFAKPDLEAATQEENISYQTGTLEGSIFVDDSAAKKYQLVQNGFTTEDAALAAINAVLTPAST